MGKIHLRTFLYCLAFWLAVVFLASAESTRTLFSNGKIFYHKIHKEAAETTTRSTNTKSDSPTPKNGVQELWFTQTLDHFILHDQRKWQQRYFMSTQFYRPGGPVFLIIDGESTSSSDNLIGNWFHNTLAEKWGAFMFLVEHRYYGESHPTEDTSTENLKYLSSQQALKDLETFVAEMKKIHNLQHNKWVSWGGSYPGSLSARFRMQCPSCVHAAVALSAPLKLDVDYPEYFDVVINSLFEKHSQDCIDRIRDAVGQIQQLVHGGAAEWKKLIRIFDICEPLEKTTLNIQNMYSDLAQTIAAPVVQYNEDHIKPNETGLHNVNIADVCDIMTRHTGAGHLSFSPIERYAHALKFVNEKYGVPDGCFDVSYNNWIKFLKQDSWSSNSVSGGDFGFRQWMYQTCAEFGFFQTSTFGSGKIFGDFPVEYFYPQCVDVFGPKFNKDFVTKSVQATSDSYDGIEGTKRATRIIFTNGKIDPWHVEGVLGKNQTNPLNRVLFMSDTAHCADFFKKSPLDSVPLQYTLTQVEAKLQEYLGLSAIHKVDMAQGPLSTLLKKIPLLQRQNN